MRTLHLSHRRPVQVKVSKEFGLFVPHRQNQVWACLAKNRSRPTVVADSVQRRIDGRLSHLASQDFLQVLAGLPASTLRSKWTDAMPPIAEKPGKPGLMSINRTPVALACRKASISALGVWSALFFHRKRCCCPGAVPPDFIDLRSVLRGALRTSPALTEFSSSNSQSPNVHHRSAGDQTGHRRRHQRLMELGGAGCPHDSFGVGPFCCRGRRRGAADIWPRLLSFSLPSNNLSKGPFVAGGLDESVESGKSPQLNEIGAAGRRRSLRNVRQMSSDECGRDRAADFMRVSYAGHAANMVVGFSRKSWQHRGIIANQPAVLARCASIIMPRTRAARFISVFDICVQLARLVTNGRCAGYLPRASKNRAQRDSFAYGAELSVSRLAANGCRLMAS